MTLTEDIETAGLDSLGSWLRLPRKAAHAAPPGAPCANCGATLLGPWCYVCGQSGEDFHRSLGHLIGEVFESFFHFDGRLWRTLPNLLLRPDRLTRDFLAGHRAPQIPPLRLFLVVLLLVFLTGSVLDIGKVHIVEAKLDDKGNLITEQQVDKITAAQLAEANRQIKQALPLATIKAYEAKTGWLGDRIKAVADDPERFLLILERWGERFAFLALPLATLLLSLLFISRREFFAFDHAIFALHSLSALGILLSVVFVLNHVTASASWLLLAAPIHLFRHMRGVYGTSVAGTLVRMGLLFAGSVVGFGLIVVGLIAVGLNGMG